MGLRPIHGKQEITEKSTCKTTKKKRKEIYKEDCVPHELGLPSVDDSSNKKEN